MPITVKTLQSSYDIVIEKGALLRIGEILNLKRRVLVVTDSGVPSEYSNTVLNASKEGTVLVLPEGESSKNIDNLQLILKKLVENNFTRTDVVVAVGGGMIGDLSGFAASMYMRGIDFYNIPTTVLSQVDSSIGGKTAIDFMGIKNIVGAFYQPKRVVIDIETLKTLPQRQISNGLCEAFKMACTSDKSLFEIFEKCEALNKIETVIEKALLIKKDVVEKDEREAGLRKILNFGHTVAHAVESADNMKNLYHGECVAIGMPIMCSPKIRNRVESVLKSLGLKTELSYTVDELIELCKHDKKTSGDKITIVYLEDIENFELREISFSELKNMIREAAQI